ncbi:hypothetical protein Mal48_07070 [Thalassoglobus polymorphus]|uniref:Uncharacterized protein n=1 Tax=Thalassoglobus polymorphus TaxID=2527994 RepID=A0A517QIK8_9PLAN|nr:hypothetical protein Mal48_07070 [Thalassoglobus polymorphus]
MKEDRVIMLVIIIAFFEVVFGLCLVVNCISLVKHVRHGHADPRIECLVYEPTDFCPDSFGRFSGSRMMNEGNPYIIHVSFEQQRSSSSILQQ